MLVFDKVRFSILSNLIANLPASYARHISVVLRYGEKHGDIRLRELAYRKLLKQAGTNIVIKPGTFIKEPEQISLGNNISIQEYCVLSGYGGLQIGNDVSIATGCCVFSSTHVYDNSDKKIRETELEKKAVTIGSNVWVGAGCKILGGVTIGNDVVIGAGSVVTRSLPDNGVYAGIPAKKIKSVHAMVD